MPVRALVVLCLAALAAPSLFSADEQKTNFSGKWIMVKEKSEWRKFSAPDSLVYTIDHRNPVVNVHVVTHRNKLNQISDLVYYTDGRETLNDPSGRESKSHCYWDGDILVIHSQTHLSNGDPSITDVRWELSSDKQTLTMTSHVETNHMEDDFKLVLEREKP